MVWNGIVPAKLTSAHGQNGRHKRLIRIVVGLEHLQASTGDVDNKGAVDQRRWMQAVVKTMRHSKSPAVLTIGDVLVEYRSA